MPDTIEDFVFGLAFGKADTRNLDKAEKQFNQAEERRAKQVKETSRRIERIRDQLTKATTREEKQQLRRQLRNLQRYEKRAKAAYRSAAKEAKEAGRIATKASKDQARALDRFKGAIRSGARGAAGAAGGVIAGAAAGMLALSRNTVQSARELDQWSRAMGVSASDLSAFQEGMRLARVPVDNAREAVKTLRENLGELARIGTGPAKDAMGSLGLELEDLQGLGVEEQMAVFADAIRDVGDPAKQLSIAIEIMGEDGRALLPVLREGGDAIRGLGDQARATGAVLDDDMIQRAKELDARMAEVEAQVRGAGLTMVEALIPALTDSAEGVAGFVENNEEFIKQDMPTVIRTLADAFGSVASAIAGASRQASDFANELADIDQRVQVSTGGEFSLFAAIANPIGAAGFALGRDAAGKNSDAYNNVVGTRDARALTESGRRQIRAEQAAQKRLGAMSQALDAQVSQAFNATQIAPDAATEALRRGAGARRSALFEIQELVSQGGDARELAAQRGISLTAAELKQVGGGRGGGRGRSKQNPELMARARDLLGSDLERLATEGGAGDVAVQESLQAAAAEFGKGSNAKVAREAALRRLGRSTGQDLVNQDAMGDPLMSELFGENVPDAELSKIARGATPQTLVSNITNTFSFDIDQAISGSGDAGEIARQVSQRIRSDFEGSIEKSTKMAKVVFRR